MTNSNIPFEIINWAEIAKIDYEGTSGFAFWQTKQFDGIRIRLVEYTKGYIADHWCEKGHIVHCLDGEFLTESKNGERILLTKGMTYVVSDNLSSHKSISENGVKLLIIDGDFLKYEK
ncbi:MAG: DHCW motif cupin fold protein [Melioribacteraceae bacterium]